MGINMDLDHVYFSNLKNLTEKLRRLNLAELGQISGRAGRHLNDGYFGTTGDCKDINADEVDLEQHKFDEIKTIFWRNSDLNFSSLKIFKFFRSKNQVRNWLRKFTNVKMKKFLNIL